MNLFVTDDSPELCAQALDDKRVGKLLMESNQMMSLAIKTYLPVEEWVDHVGEGRVTAGLAHLNHPVSKWVRLTRANFTWTLRHAFALSLEFEWRFGRFHSSGHRTPYIAERFANCVPEGDLTPFQNSAKNDSVGVDMTWIDPTTEAYRAYLLARWPGDRRPPVWTRRGEPSWAKL